MFDDCEMDRDYYAEHWFEDEEEDEKVKNRRLIMFYRSQGYDSTNIAYLCELPLDEVEDYLEEEGLDTEPIYPELPPQE